MSWRWFSRCNRGSSTSHRRLISAGLYWFSSGWEMREVTEISTSFISSGLLLLKPRSPRNEMKPFLKTEAAVAQLGRRKHLFKKQFLWPVTFCKPSLPPACVSDIGVWARVFSFNPGVLSNFSTRNRGWKRQRANFCLLLNLLNTLFSICSATYGWFFSKAPRRVFRGMHCRQDNSPLRGENVRPTGIWANTQPQKPGRLTTNNACRHSLGCLLNPIF